MPLVNSSSHHSPVAPIRLVDNVLLTARARGVRFLPSSQKRIGQLREAGRLIFVIDSESSINAGLMRRRLLELGYRRIIHLSDTGCVTMDLDGWTPDSAGLISISSWPSRSSRTTALFTEFIRHTAESTESWILVPCALMWTRIPSPRIKNARYQCLRYGGNGLLSIGNPVDLSGFLDQYGHLTTPAIRLRRLLLARIGREKHVIAGAKNESRSQLVHRILHHPAVTEKIAAITKTSGKTADYWHRKGREYILEIAADYWDLLPRMWVRVFKLFLGKIYASIEFDDDGLQRLKSLLRRRKRIILMPSHRSHMDYIVLSLGFYKEGVLAPLVAAGKNLAFFPMGWIFRHTGAFYIRRSFKGLILYPIIFRYYLYYILTRFHPIEFFIEGGRSRNGRFRTPKLGMLNMLISAFHEGVVPDFYFVPIAINYDRIREEDSYIRELKGIPKRSETLMTMIKNWRVVKKDCGRIYVSISDPISIRTLLEDNPESQDVKDLIGTRIMTGLGRSMTVTPVSLLSTAIHMLPGKHRTRDTIIRTAVTVKSYLDSRQCVQSGSLADATDVVEVLNRGLDFLQRTGVFKPGMESPGSPAVLELGEDKAFVIDYAMNSLLTDTLPLSLSAVAYTLGSDSDPAETLELLTSLACPLYLPVSRDVVLDSAEQALTFVSSLPAETIRRLTRIAAPLLNPLASAADSLQNSEEDGISSDRLEQTMLSAITQDFPEDLYPQYSSSDHLKTLVKCLQKGKLMVRCRDGYKRTRDPRLARLQSLKNIMDTARGLSQM